MTITANVPKNFSGPLSLFSINGNSLTLDYMVYYPLYNSENLITQLKPLLPNQPCKIHTEKVKQ
jgi:hypothetical protein